MAGGWRRARQGLSRREPDASGDIELILDDIEDFELSLGDLELMSRGASDLKRMARDVSFHARAHCT